MHSEVGPGCFERIYEGCLAKLLRDGGLRVERQVPVAFCFRGENMGPAFRADLMVEDVLIVEVKSVPALLPIHFSQVRTYLSLANRPIGLLLNFGAQHLRDGYERIIHPGFAFLPPARTGPSGASGDPGDSGAGPAG